jgi:PadR family transcriptional regulator AphA
MSLRHALLGLLAEEPGSGYDLMRKFDLSLANVWPATQSQIYTELTRLADAGLITVSAEGPRGRKEYAITGEGRAELRKWMLDPAPPQPVRYPLLLRTFFLNAIEPDEARDLLARGKDRAIQRREELCKLQDSVDWEDGDPLSVYGRLALEWALRYTAMHAEWAEWAIGQIPEK